MNPSHKWLDLRLDQCGRLYDRRAREMLDPLVGPEAARRLECFAAMRWLIQRSHQRMERWLEKHGLTEGRMQILMRLRHQGDVPLGELAEGMRVSPRNVTGLVDNLERDGLVERVPDATDRRSVHAHLTERGKELIDGIWREALQRSLVLTEGMSQDDLDLLRDTCLRMVQRLESAMDGLATTEERSQS